MSEEKTNYLPITATIRPRKQIGTITLCGTLHIAIFDNQDFIHPTPEQIKNLHDMLCIDVKLLDEDTNN